LPLLVLRSLHQCIGVKERDKYMVWTIGRHPSEVEKGFYKYKFLRRKVFKQNFSEF
jgi:hypothetical protein